MSKTVIIPTTENPWVCCINGVYYSYPAGATAGWGSLHSSAETVTFTDTVTEILCPL